jgi:hypothetical protein
MSALVMIFMPMFAYFSISNVMLPLRSMSLAILCVSSVDKSSFALKSSFENEKSSYGSIFFSISISAKLVHSAGSNGFIFSPTHRWLHNAMIAKEFRSIPL